MDGLFAIGDQCIQTTDPAYPGGHPQLAQVAIQQAALLAKNIQKIAGGGATDFLNQLKPFRYKNLGSMATIRKTQGCSRAWQVPQSGLLLPGVLWLSGSPPLHPRSKEQGNGIAQLALEVRELQRLHPNDYLRHQA